MGQCSNNCGTPPLVNPAGGNVQTAPQTYLIFWGSNWNSDGGVRQAVDNFYHGLNGSLGAWTGITSQYCGPNGCISPTASVAGEWTDPQYLHPTGVNDAAVQGEINRAINTPGSGWAGADSNPNAQFIVIPARYTTYASGYGNSFCGYHGIYGPATYTFVGNAFDSTGRFGSCASDGNNGTNATTVVGAHEYAESATDPHLNAWVSSDYSYEVADLCASGGDQFQTSGIWVQGLWDNHTGNCSLYDPGPPAVSPSVTSGAATNVGETTATFNGTSNPHGMDTHYYFQYGTTTSYGQTAPAPPGDDIGAGTSNVQLSEDVSGLQPGTTYHYRSVVTSFRGTQYGADETLKTLGDTSPSVVLNPSTGYQAIYRVNATRAIAYNAYVPGTGWISGTLGGQAAPGTSPSAISNPSDGYQAIYYVSSNKAISYYSWASGSGWSSGTLGGQVAPGTSPSVVFSPATGYQAIYYQNTSGGISYWSWASGSGWTSGTLGGQAAPGTSPSAISNTGDGYQAIYYQNASGGISSWSWAAGSGWTNATRGGHAAPYTSPSAVNNPNDGYQAIYYHDSTGAISYWSWAQGTGWTSGSRTANAAPGSSPSAVINTSSGYQGIYYEDNGGNLSYWSWAPAVGWTSGSRTAQGVPFSSPAAVMNPNDGYQAIYYKNSSAGISYWSWASGTGWSSGTL